MSVCIFNFFSFLQLFQSKKYFYKFNESFIQKYYKVFEESHHMTSFSFLSVYFQYLFNILIYYKMYIFKYIFSI